MNLLSSSWRFKEEPILLLVSLILLLLSGCSTPNTEAPVFVNGKHLPGWNQEHGAAFRSNDLSCRQCHGADLREGGLLGAAAPTCFAASIGTTICHGSLSGPWHNQGNNPLFFSRHGELAQREPLLGVDGPQGFSFCAPCHGLKADGAPFPGQRQGEESPAKSCVACHAVQSAFTFVSKPAPHAGADAWDFRHGATSPENAGSCAECHRNRDEFRGGRWGFIPFVYDAAAAPGCFNNTLCHGQDINPHADQVNWATAPLHGLQAKESPQRGSLYGFANCGVCHGAQFTGNCTNLCHAPPHPAAWKSVNSGGVTHVSTHEENAATCALCHSAGALSPLSPPPLPAAGTLAGCYNNTLCHGAMTPHDSSWSAPNRHGSSAKLPPPPTGLALIDQFVNCRNCHGPYFDVNKCGSCHQPPHPADWSGFGPYSHTSTDASNGSACLPCHAVGSSNNPLNPVNPAPPGTAPGCFNSTLCHGDENQTVPANHNPPEVWSLPANHGSSAKAAPSPLDSAQSFTRCAVCHGTSNWTNCAGFCHTPPHPDAWSGNGTPYSHQTTEEVNATVCAICHAGGRTPAVPLPLPPGSEPGCFNISLCH